MAKYWVPLLSILYKDEEALWGKLTTGTLFFFPSGGSPSQPESRLGSGDSKSANSTTLHCSMKSSPTTDLRHTTSSWNANTEVLGRQQKVKSLTRLLLRLLLFFWSHREWPFPPAFFSHQIQVDQGKTFRVLYDFSRALDERKRSVSMLDICNFSTYLKQITTERLKNRNLLVYSFSFPSLPFLLSLFCCSVFKISENSVAEAVLELTDSCEAWNSLELAMISLPPWSPKCWDHTLAGRRHFWPSNGLRESPKTTKKGTCSRMPNDHWVSHWDP